ncbi:beta-L-arabinofuranosidase domain-containing protein [Jiangella muralis]|uniref:beta-L-arabinofuranosidase domain-containing protein n=1 Tax=Jiangella muralis TaxID=702383 RepID=UPI0009F9BCA9|nr:beta-L-arabinofuranosidase domain-containing protein [Jiangella muralis]
MTLDVRSAGSLRAHLGAAAAQLAASTPYSVELVAQDVRWDPGSPRLFQDYRGDLSGRYLDAVEAAVADGHPVDGAKSEAVLRAVLAAQQPDGFFGPPALALQVDQGAAWGHGRLLHGLLSARRWAADGAAVDAATALLADGIGARVPQWLRWVVAAGRQKFRLDPFSAVLPLALHAEASGAKPALVAARTLAEALPADADRAHMHGYLLALRGQLEVARLTGADDLLRDAQERADVVAQRYLLPHGGVTESLTLPWDANTEGCGIADWVMLNLRLYQLLDDPRYLDRAVVAAFNALLHTQRASGHFGCETLSGEDGVLLSDYAPEAWWCCTFHGLRALRHLVVHAVDADADVVRVHLPLALTARDGAGVPVLTVTGDYPYGDTVELTTGPGLRAAELHVRVPSTAGVRRLLVGGAPARASAADGWLRLAAPPPGTTVTVELAQHEWFDVDGEATVPPFANTTLPAPDLATARVAAFRGPLLLAASTADNPPDDVLRGRFLVHPREQRAFVHEAGGVRAATSGHDSFAADLTLAPLAGSDRSRHDRTVRTWFQGLLYARRTLHH